MSDRRGIATGVWRGLAPVLTLALLVSACAAPSVAPPTSVPVSTTGSAPPAESWEGQWNALLAAAREEGTVAVLGPPTPELRRRLPEAFQQRFGIAVEYTGQPSGDFAARLASERSAGVYSADVVISGSNSMYEVLADRGGSTTGSWGCSRHCGHLCCCPRYSTPPSTARGNSRSWTRPSSTCTG